MTAGSGEAYWNGVAEEKTFTHDVEFSWLEKHAHRGARVLDYGCGYGRTVGQLAEHGWCHVTGFDSSEKMIARARRELPEVRFFHRGNAPGLDEAAPFDVVLLLAVLTCNPVDSDLAALLQRVEGLMHAGSLLFISDLWIQADERNQQRYEDCEDETWGVFQLPEGPLLRHFAPEFIQEFLAHFEPLEQADHEVLTMNGNRAQGFRVLARFLG